MRYERVVLVGLSGSGKSTVSRLLAARLGWAATDTDALLAVSAGESIPRIFAERGEAAFRALETEALRAVCEGAHRVIATGGGVVTVEANWAIMRGGRSLVVHLAAPPDTLVARLAAHAAEAGEDVAARPLLAGQPPAAALRAMHTRRAAAYARADLTIETGSTSPEQIAGTLAALVRGEATVLWEDIFDTDAHPSHLAVGSGLLDALAARVAARWPEGLSGVVLVTDERVQVALGARMRVALAALDIPLKATLTVPAGEPSKSLIRAGELYGQLAACGADRRTAIVALGGGVVGDLAGFVAATYLRGVPLVQVPTSLLAMVDSSVGGKTAVDLPAGKNLVGAFYQPHLVVVDPTLLGTLPEREFISGWAEIAKHGLIEGSVPGVAVPSLAATLTDRAGALRARDPLTLTSVIARNVALKLAVVRDDPHETTGRRAMLNIGHTAGHAIESAALALAPPGMLHGEAIALGLRAEAALAADLGLCDTAVPGAVGRLLDAFGLPRRAVDLGFALDVEAILPYIARDKKTVGGRTTWLLPVGAAGECRVAPTRDVPPDAARAAIMGVL